MHKTGLIFMTALVPTVGHKFLIDFSMDFLHSISSGDCILHVIVSGRSIEPVLLKKRIQSLMNDYNRFGNVKFHAHGDDKAPQNPSSENDVEFWNYWKGVVTSRITTPIDFVFASEHYGKKVAEILSADFIPVDIVRDSLRVKGTNVRQNIFEQQENILEDFRNYHLKKSVVLFGPESCGKTTMAKILAEKFKGNFIAEWARPYLEEVGPETTQERMKNIVHGQYALESSVESNSNKILSFKDTDLLTTLGFYRLYNMEPEAAIFRYIDLQTDDLYIVMNDDIPFEKDILRYGGDVRESKKQFWIDMLKEFKRNYYVVQSTDLDQQVEEISRVIMTTLPEKDMTFQMIKDFERE